MPSSSGAARSFWPALAENVPLGDSRESRVWLTGGAQCHPRLQRERGLGALRAGSSRPKEVHAAFDESGTEALRDVVHQSPRNFGKESALWTLQMAAEVSFEEGITQRRVTGETIRASLSRLGVRWRRAKRSLESPDPEDERKKGIEIG